MRYLAPPRYRNPGTGLGLMALLAGGLAGGLALGVAMAMLFSALEAGRTPHNRRASDRIERDRRRREGPEGVGRRSTDGQFQSAVEKLAQVMARRDEDDGHPGVEHDERSTPSGEGSADDTPTPADEPAVDDEPDTTEEPPAEPADDDEPAPADDLATNDKPTPTEEPPVGHELAEEAPFDEFDIHPTAPDPPIEETVDDPIAAHFGADVPPPPRNKAKLASGPGASTDPPPPAERSAAAAGGEGQVGADLNLTARADFGRLVAGIQQQVAHHPVTCLAIGEEHRSQSVAAALALVDELRGLDLEVLIIDAVLDEPILATAFGLPAGPGLSEVLVGEVSLESTIQRFEDFDRIHAITTGDPTPLARAAFKTPKLRKLLADVKARFPVTVVIGGDLTDAIDATRTNGELDGLIVATSATVGDPGDTVLAAKISQLATPVLVRVSVGRVAGSTTTTAAQAPTPA